MLPDNWKWNTENAIRLPRPVCAQSMRFIYRNNQKLNVKSIFNMASTLADTPLPAHEPSTDLHGPLPPPPPPATVPGIIYCAEKFHYQIMFVYVFCVSAIYIRVRREGMVRGRV